MGTRGYIVYRVRGRYYVYYNHLDSYPTGLGRGLVAGIPDDPEKFEGSSQNLPRLALLACLLADMT